LAGGGEFEADLCGGGAGPLSSVWSPFAPFGNAPGACCGAGVDSLTPSMGSLISSLGLAMFAVLRALNRRNSSGGRLRGCDSSDDFLRKANEELARGLFGFFSLSRWSRSLTKELRLFFSGDEFADLVLCAWAESVDGLGRGDGGASLGGCGGVEDFLRVKIGIGSKNPKWSGYAGSVDGSGRLLAFQLERSAPLEFYFLLHASLTNKHRNDFGSSVD